MDQNGHLSLNAEMLKKFTLHFWVRTALAVSLLYHGVWNLSVEGAAWWLSGASGFDPRLRFVIGVGEIFAAIAFLANRYVRMAALCLVPIFLGAVSTHLAMGYSYKKGGIEVPLSYLMLCIGLCLNREDRNSVT